MNAKTRRYITDYLLTTRELSRLTGISQITLKKRYARDNSLAVLKGNNILWNRRDFTHYFRPAQEHQEATRTGETQE